MQKSVEKSLQTPRSLDMSLSGRAPGHTSQAASSHTAGGQQRWGPALQRELPTYPRPENPEHAHWACPAARLCQFSSLTVTDLARLRGWSTLCPRSTVRW
jgi:hypothetical protein